MPQEVDCGTFLITFDEKGENSSLQKVSFYLPEEKKTIIYQLELGSGKFKKEVS
ncbi:Late competence protein ComGD [Lactococcus cremoris]|nr:Late competence protein ComGD [Lactococcus cremoris]